MGSLFFRSSSLHGFPYSIILVNQVNRSLEKSLPQYLHQRTGCTGVPYDGGHGGDCVCFDHCAGPGTLRFMVDKAPYEALAEADRNAPGRLH